MIYTFYSYKGGVGRTMALANIAELFYQAGLKVLMVDWDLEAPGLERFFPSVALQETLDKRGLIDMLLRYKEEMAEELEGDSLELPNPSEYIIDIYPNHVKAGKLYLLTAGRRSDAHFARYAQAVQTFDWHDFYETWGGELYFNWLRDQFESIADVILIDSRTGVTEMGGVCTYQFADIVIMFCAPNQQNMAGTYRMARNFTADPVQALRGGRPLKVLIIPARIDRAESKLLDEFQADFDELFKQFVPPIEGFDIHQLWQLNIPYIPKYAYKEIVAVRESGRASAQDMSQAFFSLIKVLTQFAPADSHITKQMQDFMSAPSFSLPTTKITLTPSITAQDEEGSIESPYGTMRLDSNFYIEREADRDCWNYLQQGQPFTLFVQGARQVGKSSLMQHITHRAKQEFGIDTAFIDFYKFTEQQLRNEEEFLIQLCIMISEALHIPEAIEEYWENSTSPHLTNIIKCSDYISKYIIPKLNQPFILAMDSTERLLLNSPFQNDFFGMLRSWHEERAWNSNLTQMSLFLSSSIPPYIFIDNPNQTPFNVPQTILLHDFTFSEVTELNRRHLSPLNQDKVHALMNLLGGHPFLTRLAFYLLTTKHIQAQELQTTSISDIGPFGKHLREQWQKISKMPQVKQSLCLIYDQTHPQNKMYYRLKGAGLVKKVGSQVVMRNDLYKNYFKEYVND